MRHSHVSRVLHVHRISFGVNEMTLVDNKLSWRVQPRVSRGQVTFLWSWLGRILAFTTPISPSRCIPKLKTASVRCGEKDARKPWSEAEAEVAAIVTNAFWYTEAMRADSFSQSSVLSWMMHRASTQICLIPSFLLTVIASWIVWGSVANAKPDLSDGSVCLVAVRLTPLPQQ
jgi:hypothetical protein